MGNRYGCPLIRKFGITVGHGGNVIRIGMLTFHLRNLESETAERFCGGREFTSVD